MVTTSPERGPFKVGDRVKVVNSDYFSLLLGDPILHVYEDGDGCWTYVEPDDRRGEVPNGRGGYLTSRFVLYVERGPW